MKKGYFQNKLFGFEEKKEYHNTDAKFLSFLCLNQDIRKWVGQTSAWRSKGDLQLLVLGKRFVLSIWEGKDWKKGSCL